MQNFNLGSLVDWSPVALGEISAIDVAEDGYRTCEFGVLASDAVRVYVVDGDESWLVGVGSGQFSVKFTVHRPVGLAVFGPDDAEVFLRTHVRSQLLDEFGEPAFTTIEPRRAQNSEVERMMRIMRLNSDLRERQLRAEMEARIAQAVAANAVVVEPAAAGAPKAQEDGNDPPAS